MVKKVTERVRAEEDLRQSEERYRDLYEEAPIAYFSVGVDGRIRRVNRSAAELVGHAPDQLIGRPVLDLYADTPAGKAKAEKVFRRFLAGQEIRGEELEMRGADGGEVWISLSVRPIRDRQGRIVASRSIVVDITERKRMEEALRESEKRYRDLVESINDVIFEVDASGRMTYISPAVEAPSRYTPSEIIGRYFTDFLHPDDVPALAKSFEKGLSGDPEPSEYRLWSKSGEILWARSFSRPIFDGDRIVGLRGVLTNITERKRAEEALWAEHAFRKAIEDSMLAGVAVVDLDSRQTYVNPAFSRMVGWSEEELVGALPPFVYWPPEEIETIMKVFQRDISGGAQPGGVELRFRRRNGEDFDALVLVSPLRDSEGRVTGWLASVYDITERKKTEQALRESEERFHRLSEATVEGIVIHDKGRILDANEQYAKMFGYDAAEVIGMHALDLTASESRDLVSQNIKSQHEKPYEHLALRRDGSMFPVEVCRKSIPYRGRTASVAAVRDITERKRMEEALQKVREELEARVEHQLLRRNPYGLTFRELTVLHLVAAGESDRQIGITLGISPLTAQKHISNILAKMEASSRTEAGVRAVREGLLD